MTIRYAGFALMAGIIVAIIVPLFMPGYSLINRVDQTDFPLALDAFRDAAVLAQWMTFLTFIATLTMTFGLLSLLPLANRQGGLGGKILQFGIIATVIEWAIILIATGMRHFEIHLLQRSTLPMEGTMSPADFYSAALAVHIDITAVNLAFVAMAPLASSLVGIGLAKRFPSMNIYKFVSYLLPAGGLVGLANFLFAISSPDLGIQSLLFINTAILNIQGLCLIIIGYGMYKQRPGLAQES